MDLNALRKSYRLKLLDENHLTPGPTELFEQWLAEAIDSQIIEPNAFSLATASKDATPSCRTLLLKNITPLGFSFFTNYESRKGHDLESNPKAVMLFFWRELERQVTIEGSIQKVSEKDSLAYFHERPRGHQIGAWASRQGASIPSREALVKDVAHYEEKFKDQPVPLPPYWGGFILLPSRIEFWQGRPDRLHDRFAYKKEQDSWIIERLSP